MHTDTLPQPQRRSAAHIRVPARKPTSEPGASSAAPPWPADAQPEPPRASAADLKAPPRAPEPPAEPRPRRKVDRSAAYDRLKALAASFGPKASKHDVVAALIGACIVEGIDTERAIVRWVAFAGFNGRHAAIVLANGTGADPERHGWRKGADGRFSLLA